MATRARIGIKQKSGRIIASYQHWDGYPGGLGYNLCEHWEDKKKVTEAIKLGDSSKWHYIIGDKIDFDDRSNPMYEVQNCCLLYTSPSPRDNKASRMPSSA